MFTGPGVGEEGTAEFWTSWSLGREWAEMPVRREGQ